MDTNRLLDAGERGTHLLFELDAITSAFRHDAKALQEIARRRMPEIRAAVTALLGIPALEGARDFVAGLPGEVRDVLVVLYFDLLEGRLRARSPIQ